MNGVGNLAVGHKPYNKEFTWRFKANASACLIDRVGVEPIEYIAETIKDKVVYKGQGFSAPDSCDAKGQKLNTWGMDWVWVSTDTEVAIVHTFKTARTLNKDCNSLCTRKGSDLPKTSDVPLCGNGILEAGEDCETPNKNTGCSLNCLKIGTDAPLCGNGALDLMEECDTAIPRTVGCSNKCLHAGSLPKEKVSFMK